MSPIIAQSARSGLNRYARKAEQHRQKSGFVSRLLVEELERRDCPSGSNAGGGLSPGGSPPSGGNSLHYNTWEWIATGNGIQSSGTPANWLENGMSATTGLPFDGSADIIIPAQVMVAGKLVNTAPCELQSGPGADEVDSIESTLSSPDTLFVDGSLEITGTNPAKTTSSFQNNLTLGYNRGGASAVGSLTVDSGVILDLNGGGANGWTSCLITLGTSGSSFNDNGIVNVTPPAGASTNCEYVITSSGSLTSGAPYSFNVGSEAQLNLVNSSMGIVSLKILNEGSLYANSGNIEVYGYPTTGYPVSLWVGGSSDTGAGQSYLTLTQSSTLMVGPYADIEVNGSTSTGDSSYPNASILVTQSSSIVEETTGLGGSSGAPSNFVAQSGIYVSASSKYVVTETSSYQNVPETGNIWLDGSIIFNNSGGNTAIGVFTVYGSISFTDASITENALSSSRYGIQVDAYSINMYCDVTGNTFYFTWGTSVAYGNFSENIFYGPISETSGAIAGFYIQGSSPGATWSLSIVNNSNNDYLNLTDT
jgi:hypothetical protein